MESAGEAVALKQKPGFDKREFPMTDRDFAFIRTLAKKHTGIELGDHKKEMIYSRIVRRIRSLRLDSFASYCTYLESHLDNELTDFINAITTNLTSFFREPHHFDFLRDTVLPEIKKHHQTDKRLRIWSAGCSTGEEPYSIAMTLHDTMKNTSGWNAKILATDLDSNVVAHGRAGIYSAERFRNVDPKVINKHFYRVNDESVSEGSLMASDTLKQYITFNRLNLLGDWPMKGRFDVIFCRNVVIYFSKDTQRVLFDRYAEILNPNGYLFIGHSESLHGVSRRFESLGRTIYRKVE